MSSVNVVWAKHQEMAHCAACLLDVDTYQTMCHTDWSVEQLGAHWDYYRPVIAEEPAYLGTEHNLGRPEPAQACTRCLVFSWPLAFRGELRFATRIPEPQMRMAV